MGTPQHSGHPQQMAPRANQGQLPPAPAAHAPTWLTPTLVAHCYLPMLPHLSRQVHPEEWNTGFHDWRARGWHDFESLLFRRALTPETGAPVLYTSCLLDLRFLLCVYKHPYTIPTEMAAKSR